MTRRVATTLSIQVRFSLPAGANSAMALEWVRQALLLHKARTHQGDDDLGRDIHKPMEAIDPAELLVKLLEKRTIYL